MSRIEQLKEEIKLKKIELKMLSLLERVNNLKFSDLRYSTHLNRTKTGTYLVHSYEITKNYSHITKYRVRFNINDAKHNELLKEPNFKQIIVERYRNKINTLKK